MDPMPKFIDPAKCVKCGQCTLGCIQGAKWTALDYLDEATRGGAQVLYESNVGEVLVENGRARGVMGVGPRGPFEVLSDVIIIAAGGLGTPVILQRSGIEEAGSGLFIDLLVNTYGVTQGLNQIREPTMTLVNHQFHASDGFILSPFVAQNRMVRFIELGPRGLTLPGSRLIGIMTKTADDPAGRVHPDGSVSKPVTEADQQRLNRGSSIASEILVKAGADRSSILVSKPSGAHFGGTAAVGRVVDSQLQTTVDNLFVCDASVLPLAPGMPPILTIVALAKRLAKTLAA
jgi:choline dehydrogenase-like flavoprotein